MFVRVWINKDWYHDFDNAISFEYFQDKLRVVDKDNYLLALFKESVFAEYTERKEDCLS